MKWHSAGTRQVVVQGLRRCLDCCDGVRVTAVSQLHVRRTVSQSVSLSFQSIGLSVCLPAHWSRVQLSFKCPRPEHASSGRRRSIAAPLCPRPVTLLVVCSIRTTLQRTRTRIRARSARAHESRPPPCTGGVERQASVSASSKYPASASCQASITIKRRRQASSVGERMRCK